MFVYSFPTIILLLVNIYSQSSAEEEESFHRDQPFEDIGIPFAPPVQPQVRRKKGESSSDYYWQKQRQQEGYDTPSSTSSTDTPTKSPSSPTTSTPLHPKNLILKEEETTSYDGSKNTTYFNAQWWMQCFPDALEFLIGPPQR